MVASGAAVGTCIEVFGNGSDGSPTDSCHQALALLNEAEPGQLIFSLPGPDRRKDYLAGSPGGYQSVGL